MLKTPDNESGQGFNPADYTSPAEMPEAVQGRFKKVPEGGFVREIVKTIEKGDSKNVVKRFFSDPVYRFELRQEINRAHAEALQIDDPAESQRINELLASGDKETIELVGQLEKSEQDLKILEQARQEIVNKISSETRKWFAEKNAERWTKTGHTGELVGTSCDMGGCCEHFAGTIDSKNVSVQRSRQKYFAMIDGVEVPPKEAQALYKKYRYCTVYEYRARSSGSLDSEETSAMYLNSVLEEKISKNQEIIELDKKIKTLSSTVSDLSHRLLTSMPRDEQFTIQTSPGRVVAKRSEADRVDRAGVQELLD